MHGDTIRVSDFLVIYKPARMYTLAALAGIVLVGAPCLPGLGVSCLRLRELVPHLQLESARFITPRTISGGKTGNHSSVPCRQS